MTDDDRNALVGLLGLDEMGPYRLGQLCTALGSPSAVVAAVAAGTVPHDLPLRATKTRQRLLDTWRAGLRDLDISSQLDRHTAAGIAVVAPGDPDWPTVFEDDPEPPALLFVQGDPSILHRPGVAVVGTRRCTSVGRAVAAEIGDGLARAGLVTASGLALGIDAAAHRGALDAGGAVLGVVACGLDRVYPSRNEALWNRVRAEGVLVTEYPLGSPPRKWAFPARNRIIAALSLAVVVVESKERGGSMHTVDEAEARGRPVLAVPGSVRSAASAGTNRLLVDGATPVRDALDVVTVVGQGADPGRLPLDDVADPIVRTLRAAGGPVTLDALAGDRPLAEVARRIGTLELDGTVRRGPDGYELADIP